MAASVVQPNAHVALIMPSGLHKVMRVVPDTVVSLGKFGSFPANLLIERPFHITFELLDVARGQLHSDLRVVSASELHAEALAEDDAAVNDIKEEKTSAINEDDRFDLLGEDGQYIIRNNRLTIDDPSRQALSMDEIELLKKSMNTSSGRDIIAKIMQSHSALDEKTTFSLAKYTLRKTRKYLKRFTLIPLDVNTLLSWMLHEKEPARIFEMRHEMLGLIASWSNVHHGAHVLNKMHLGTRSEPGFPLDAQYQSEPTQGRWLVVDDTSGLLVAAMAERMGILHLQTEAADPHGSVEYGKGQDAGKEDEDDEDHNDNSVNNMDNGASQDETKAKRQRGVRALDDSMSATSNSITLVHSATQPNLSLLSFFDFDPNEPSSHPLHSHLKSLSWLQLLDPKSSPTYAQEPPKLGERELKELKPSKRGAYYRKRRRWQRIVRVIDETRAGGFDGLVIATSMQTEGALRHLVPLVRGGGQVVVYSPSIEPLTQVCDTYSSARKTAFLTQLGNSEEASLVPSNDFPLDPRLLLAPTLQTARAIEWQVLPGRTHPLMTSRGGSEGYIYTGTKVIPAEGRVEARGIYNKKRKLEQPVAASAPS